MLQVGQRAPDFELPNAAMEMVKLSDWHAQKHVVLYFYPKDDTPLCTLQAIEFSDHDEEFNRLDAVVIGISSDDCLNHASFRDRHGLTVQLLADIDNEASRLYGVWQPAEAKGRVGIQRCTFIIDKEGILRHVLSKVNPRGHAAAVLKLIKEL